MKEIILSLVIAITGFLFVSTGISNAELNSNSADSTEICIVTGEEFPSGQGVKYRYLNKEVSLCCAGCIKAFKKEPANYLKDGLRCPVCDDDDGKKELSASHENVKYYFCGNGCKAKFEKEPELYLKNYIK